MKQKIYNGIIKPSIFNKTGFTLIELLVAIVIIGILISLLIVVAGKARARAHIAVCANHLRQIGIALVLYAGDHDEDFPEADDDLRPLYPSYIDDLDTFTCPATGNKLTDPNDIRTPQPGDEGVGMDYEYRGRGVLSEVGEKPPTLIDAERIATKYLLAWDSDNKGINQIIDDQDNHGALGGNKLFSDGSVRWFTADEWYFGE